jgi:hypothetical protein
MRTPIDNGFLQSDIDFAGHRALNNPDAGSASQHVFFPESYGAIGDGTTDDTTAMQACITAALAVNGTVKLSPVTYKITSALEITGSMAIEGSGMFPQNGPIASLQSINMPIVSPYLKGSVILQSGAAQNGITISGTGLGVNLRDFGIRFADAIKFTNTGHGVFSEGSDYAGMKDSGIMSSMWSNVAVYGHDGNHYAFHFTNPICCTFNHLTGWGGGGIRLESNQVQTYYGNLVFEHPYFATCVSGSAHGYHLKHTGASNGFNLVTFIRPQVNVADTGVATAPTNAQNTFKIDAFPVGQSDTNINLFAPDFETDCGATTSGLYGTVGINITSGLVDSTSHHASEWNSDITVNGNLTAAASTISAANLTSTNLASINTMILSAVTVAALPASPVTGQVACVSDGTAALAWGATVTGGGGGTTKYLVWYNGSNWTVAGK